ncbi:hypothetical protein O0882_21105 [Janthinobacterium sp. SUN073]|uniref:hypothetical protein n=1 Tax=Janthinobacterium sp. SUN073 TaxID=3004102 RepID=UPI0025AF405D|nr:hypothetical protein [Janthinobacterium sp. SUN073]MDN2698820.1 hypothetical protein [Janthinobacterium sp. SUN073]
MLIDSKMTTASSVSPRVADTLSRPENKSFAAVFASVTESAATSAGNANRQGAVADDATGAIYRKRLVDSAKADPAEAEKLLAINTAPDNGAFPLIDISNWPTVRYSVSGELQTPESEAYFAGVAASASKARVELLQQERAKGTPPAEILDKVLALNSALSPRYKAMANIGY